MSTAVPGDDVFKVGDSVRPEDAAGSALVSVVLCTYNGSRFLAAQMDSLLAQTYRNIEIVAVDDGSADDTVLILSRYAQRDPRVRIIVNPVNLGFARNFEQALGHSRGEWIAPCDQDDVWLPEKIAALVATIGSHALAYCDSTLVDERGMETGWRLSQIYPMQSLDDPLPFAFGNCVSGHAMLFHRSLLGRALPVPGAFFYDWWLATVAAAGGGVVFCERSLVLYRQHGQNITGRRLAEMQIDAGLSAIPAGDRLPERDRSDGGSAPAVSAPGWKLRHFEETRQRLDSIARLPGRHQPFAVRLLRLWRARESQWICPVLWRTMRESQARLLALTGMPARKRARYCAALLWGLRTQRLTGGRGWSPS